MFIDASPKYTDTNINYKKENPIVVERFVKTARDISNYSHTAIITNITTNQTTDYTYMAKKQKATPESLKKAMFRISSPGIVAALKK